MFDQTFVFGSDMVVVQDGSNLVVERLVAVLVRIPFVFAIFGGIFVTAVWADPGHSPPCPPEHLCDDISSINSAIRDSSGPSPASYCFWAVLCTMGVWGILPYGFFSSW